MMVRICKLFEYFKIVLSKLSNLQPSFLSKTIRKSSKMRISFHLLFSFFSIFTQQVSPVNIYAITYPPPYFAIFLFCFRLWRNINRLFLGLLFKIFTRFSCFSYMFLDTSIRGFAAGGSWPGGVLWNLIKYLFKCVLLSL